MYCASFGYKQRIPTTTMQYDGGVLDIIDDICLYFIDHLVTSWTHASEPFATWIDLDVCHIHILV